MSKTLDDLVSPLFVLTGAVEAITQHLGGKMDEQTTFLISKMETAVLDLYNIVEELRKQASS